MEKIINALINSSIEGVGIYNHNGSTWLIFTETKQWVIELTESKTLWYNYNFFNSIFSYASLEVVQNQHLITKWVEDNIIDNSVRHTDWGPEMNNLFVDDALENGVKETKMSPTYTEYGDWLDGDERLDDIIQNGVKETQFNTYENKSWVEGVIKEGVKQTLPELGQYINDVEEVIKEGVKKTHFDSREIKTWIDGVINKGVKQTLWISAEREWLVRDTLEKGIKKTKSDNGDLVSAIEWMDENKTNNVPKMIDDIIENGVKEVHPLPAQDWNGDWGKYYHGKEDRTKPFNEYLNDALEIGVKIN